MPDIIVGSGTELYIAPSANAPATQDQAGWEGVTGWLKVGEVTGYGPYGNSRTINELKTMDGVVYYYKGVKVRGRLPVSCALQPEDTGQALLKAGVDAMVSYPCKIVYNDATAALDVPGVDYFMALIGKFEKNPGAGPDDAVKADSELAINSDIVEVARHATP